MHIYMQVFCVTLLYFILPVTINLLNTLLQLQILKFLDDDLDFDVYDYGSDVGSGDNTTSCSVQYVISASVMTLYLLY